MSTNQRPRQRLATALQHEFRRASNAFDEFVLLGLLPSRHRVATTRALELFDAYARFIHHLYEFYKGCFDTDGAVMSSHSGQALDDLMQSEVVKLMSHRADRIAKGHGPSWKNDAAFYRETVPAGFGRAFRNVRNQLAHVSVDRTVLGSQRALPTFYKKYHRYALLLFEAAQWFWIAEDEAKTDWGEIARFGAAVGW